MTKYSQFISDEIGDINTNYTINGLGAGASAKTVSHNNVALADVRTISHNSDSGGRRIVQVTEFTAGDVGTTNTSLDFDLADEGSFIQEDADNGTDFAGGVVKLKGTTSNSFTYTGYQFTNTAAHHYVNSYGNVAATVGGYGGNNGGRTIVYEKINGVWTIKYSKLGSSSRNGMWEYTQPNSKAGHVSVLDNNRVYYTEKGSSTGTSRLGLVYKNPSTGNWSDTGYINHSADNNNSNLRCGSGGDIVVFGKHTQQDQKIWIYKNADTAVDIDDLILQTTFQYGSLNPGGLEYDYGYWLEVSKDGQTIFVGAPQTGKSYQDTGAVYIYQRDGDNWTEASVFTYPASRSIGKTICCKDNTLALYGTNIRNNYGEVYIYEKEGTNWGYKQKISQNAGDFGWQSISIDGNIMMIGARAQKRVYYYKKINNVWTYQTYVSDATTSFGAGVGYSQGNLAVCVDGADRIDFYELGSSYTTSQPYYVTTSDDNHLSLSDITTVNSCTITNSQPAGTTISGLVSFDGRNNWMKWTGATWSGVSGLNDLGNGNTISEIETGLTAITVSGTGYTHLDFAFDLNTTVTSVTPEIDQITLNYDEAGTYRTMSPDEYDVDFISDTETKVTKKSAGTSNLKVVVRL